MRLGGLRRGLLLATIVATTTVAGAAPAWAITRYAAPGGTAVDTVCVSPQAPRCSIGMAAGGPNVVAADEAIILPGNYSDSGGDLNGDDDGNPAEEGMVQPSAGSVHGAAGQPRPIITLNAADPHPNGAFLLGDTTLSHVEINAGTGATTFPTSALTLGDFDSTAEDVIARSARDDAITCKHWLGILRDSVCFSSGSGGIAVGASLASPRRGVTIFLRNVTAVSSGPGSNGLNYLFTTFDPPNAPDYTVSVKGVIAQGTSHDAVARAGPAPSRTTVNLDHSNYDTGAIFSSGGFVHLTNPITGPPDFNVTAAPLLAADGYHQLAGSPTINAGQTDLLSGSGDIDGQLRQIGLAAPDIGADEFAIPSATRVTCGPSPVVVGAASACTATVTAPAEFIGGTVKFSSNQPSGSFSGSGSCTLPPAMSSTRCTLTYTADAVGSGIHRITGAYLGDASHDPSQGNAALSVTEPPAAGQTPIPPGATGNDPCPVLRDRLARAKKRLKSARKADRPTKKKKRKVRRLKRDLAANGC